MTEKINQYVSPYHWGTVGFYKKRYERNVELIVPHLSSTDRVLDVGCGDARLTALISKYVGHVTGVDNQIGPIKMALPILHVNGLNNVTLQVADATALPFADESFDKVTCFDMIEHVPKDVAIKVAKELCRVTKHGGHVYITTPNRRELRGRIFGHTIEDKHYHEYTIGELRGIFESLLDHMQFQGIYIPPPIPKSEHVANLFPVRRFFDFLILAGENYPELSNTILMSGTRI